MGLDEMSCTPVGYIDLLWKSWSECADAQTDLDL